MIAQYWYQIFKPDFYESMMVFALKNATRGILEEELLSFLASRGYPIIKDEELEILVTYNNLFEKLWSKNGDKFYVNTECLHEILLLKNIRSAKLLSNVAIFISIFSVFAILSFSAIIFTQNTKTTYSFFLKKQVELLEYMNSNLEHLRFNKMSEQ
ncbi:MAG: hypothetical protein HRT47_01035 [Candidatus Caenarcaniphilales bacterium]|nr:hypothetical protein [Candidatus Caenarcaniphilales bacterium]